MSEIEAILLTIDRKIDILNNGKEYNSAGINRNFI